MILTGKALEHYKIWFDKYYNDYWTYYQSKPTILNALIIEWFDSIGIYIEVYRHNNRPTVQGFNSRIVRRINGYYECCTAVDTRKEATEEAIKKANEIYNGKYSISQ